MPTRLHPQVVTVSLEGSATLALVICIGCADDVGMVVTGSYYPEDSSVSSSRAEKKASWCLDMLRLASILFLSLSDL